MKRISNIKLSFILIVIIALALIAMVIFFYDQRLKGIENSVGTPDRSHTH